HELVGIFRVGEEPHLNNVELGRHGRSRSNVWHYAGVNTFRANRLDELKCHPTVKPVALVADAIRDCTRRGDIVLDIFAGSGTTILAAERIGRRAYALESEPSFVDVAIKRWQAFSGKDAICADTGLSFDDIASKRNAIYLRITNDAVSGNDKAQSKVIALMQSLGLHNDPQEETNRQPVTADDDAVIADFLRRRGIEVKPTPPPESTDKLESGMAESPSKQSNETKS